MTHIQKQFEEFHQNIKLKRFTENKELREKRDIITRKIKDGVKKRYEEMDKEAPEIEFVDQGSYAVDLGIAPEDKDYDIDVGVIFDLYKEEHNDPVEIKKDIRDILNTHTSKRPEINKPCLTVKYSIEGEDQFHVDLPIYMKSEFSSDIYLGWGKEFSSNKNKYWEHADPKGLKDFISNAFTDEDQKKQFKRVVRYMKKWKDVRFTSSGNSRPPSVGITVMAADLFSPVFTFDALAGKNRPNDLKALKAFVTDMKKHFILQWDADSNKFLYKINYNLPVKPYKDVFSKMSNEQMNYFYQQLESFQNALVEAEHQQDPHDACKTLSPSFLGDKFPVPESKDDRYGEVGLSSAPSSNSAKV